MTATYTLSKRVTPDGKTEVLLRFRGGNACDQHARTGIRVPAASWRDGRLVIPRRLITPAVQELINLQKRLDDLSSFLFDGFTAAGGYVPPKWLQMQIRAFHGTCTAATLLSDYTMQYAAEADMLPSTRTRYKVLAHDLQAFRPVYIETVTAADVQAFADYLRQRGVCQNTATSKLKGLRAVINYARMQGRTQADPFAAYKIPTEKYGSITYLTATERDIIATAEMPTRALAVQRDIFVFQCWTGVRISDLYQLRRENITNDGFLQYIARKTRRSLPVVVRVPLSDTALAIIDRYKAYKTLLPLISKEKYNEAIKRVLKAAKIDRQVVVQDPLTYKPRVVQLCDIASSHLARRTFAEIAFQATGSERVVSAMTGHSPSSAAFRRYTEVDDDMKAAALKITRKTTK